MRRREVIAGLAGTAATWPFVARAQQPALPHIGLLLTGGANINGTGTARNSIIESLAEQGYVAGKTARIEERSAGGQLERLPELARELVALPVDVIIAVAASATVAARQATATIPIVMVHVGDPIGYGLIQSLAHPGGNVTGTTSYLPEIVAKGIELLRELVPAIRRLAVLVVPSNTGTPLTIHQAQVAARSLGLDLTIVGVERAGDLDTAFATIERAGADSLYVSVEPMLYTNRARLLELAAQTRLPTMYSVGAVARDGGLIGYSPMLSAHWPRASRGSTLTACTALYAPFISHFSECCEAERRGRLCSHAARISDLRSKRRTAMATAWYGRVASVRMCRGRRGGAER